MDGFRILPTRGLIRKKNSARSKNSANFGYNWLARAGTNILVNRVDTILSVLPTRLHAETNNIHYTLVKNHLIVRVLAILSGKTEVVLC
jgi:hypothetical protein